MSGRISEIETKTDFVDSDLKYMQEKPDRKEVYTAEGSDSQKPDVKTTSKDSVS